LAVRLVLVLVVVLVLEKINSALTRVIAQSLEGSRFGACSDIPLHFAFTLTPLKHVKTGGSRERLNATYLLWRSICLHRVIIELRSVETFTGAACLPKLGAIHALRRISRGRWMTRQSGSPPDFGNKRTTLTCPKVFEDEDDDEYEDDIVPRTLQTGPRGWLRLEDPAVPSP
jgi:hypothetical protein